MVLKALGFNLSYLHQPDWAAAFEPHRGRKKEITHRERKKKKTPVSVSFMLCSFLSLSLPQDITSLLHTIYEVVDASVNHSPNSSKTLRVKLSVAPDSSQKWRSCTQGTTGTWSDREGRGGGGFQRERKTEKDEMRERERERRRRESKR